MPRKPQDFFADIPQCRLLLSFPRWADPLESDLIQAQTQHQPLVTATVCGCGVDSLCPPGPALQAKCHRVRSHHSLWHSGLAHQAAECLRRVCLNTGNLWPGKGMLLDKESLYSVCTIFASANALRRGTLVYGGPQDSEIKFLWVSELQM